MLGLGLLLQNVPIQVQLKQHAMRPFWGSFYTKMKKDDANKLAKKLENERQCSLDSSESLWCKKDIDSNYEDSSNFSSKKKTWNGSDKKANGSGDKLWKEMND